MVYRKFNNRISHDIISNGKVKTIRGRYPNVDIHRNSLLFSTIAWKGIFFDSL